MPQSWSSQSGDDPDDFETWRVRRNAQLALRTEADAVARSLWNQSTQNGDGLYAGNPSDLTAIGLAALGGTGSYKASAANDDGQDRDDGTVNPIAAPGARRSISADVGGPLHFRTSIGGSGQGTPTSGNQSLVPDSSLASAANQPWVSEIDVIGRPTPAPPTDFLDSLNHNPLVRGAAGVAGYAVGLPAGALRAGWHALEGVGHGLNFAGSLFFPEGRAAAWNDATAATHNSLQYGRSVAANPSRLASDALSAARSANRSLNPWGTPIPGTATGAFGHELGKGANAGETLANVAGVIAAPEVAAGVNAARTFAATREANVAEMMARGIDGPTARYLSKPYKGEGEHALIQKSQKSILGVPIPGLEHAPIPRWFMDSPLNVSRPRGMSQYDFYKYHYGVDRQFKGGRLPDDPSGPRGFSGKRWGFERYSNPERTWARIPPIWKDYYAAVAGGEAMGSLPQGDSRGPQ